MIQGETERVAASIGIAVYPAHGSDAEALMRGADTAMYSAKRVRSGYAIADFGAGQQRPHPADAGPGNGIIAATGPPPTRRAPGAPAREELQSVNERLLLAGLRERELADQLRRQLAFTSAIVGNLGEGVCALDSAGRITFVNPAAERLLGWSEADLLGREWAETLHTRRADAGPLLATLSTGAAYRADDESFARRGGGTLAVAYTAAPIVADAAVIGAVVVFRDNAERRRAEAERAALLARVEAALAFRTRFLSITAHELKTPLTVLSGTAQLLLRRAGRGGDERLQRSLEAIDGQVARMARLIADLADVARIESAGLALDSQPLDLRALLAEVVAEVGLAAPDFALRLDQATDAVWVRGDRDRLQQVLTNLLTNAVKYADRHREAEITLRQVGDRATIAVTDYGIGIPAAQQATVFEPYVRAANATAGDYDGLGLGLFISKAIVDRHGGTLTLVSAEGRGSTFTVELPALAPACRGADE